MLDAVTAATEKMAGAAVLAGGSSHALGDFVPVRWMVCFPVALEDHGLRCGVAGTCRKFFIGPGLFVANQTIDFGLVAEIKVISFPAISGMTGCATSLVAFDIHSEVVNGQPALAQHPALRGGRIEPGPMDGFVELGSRLGMTGKACFGNFRTGLEFHF